MHDPGPLAAASDILTEGVAALRAASGSAAADTRVAALQVCERLTRQVEQLSTELIAGLDRDGVFVERGYRRPALAVADLLGCDTAVAARRVRAAGQVSERVSMTGEVLPPRLPATAHMFAAGQVSLRHVEVIADALDSSAAARLTPTGWAGVEEQLAAHAGMYRPRELAVFARDLVTAYDQDGPEPDHHEPPQVNELFLSRLGPGGGRITGCLDAPTYDAVATALDALSAPVTGDTRSPGERNADALGELARQVLDAGGLPTVGGERPHLAVTISLSDLEDRARNATLDFGGALTASQLRMLACDARIVPVVLGGTGQPLDVGRAMRTVPPHLRRAVMVRDRGCAFPGCDRPPSWTEVHHLWEWQHGGPTELNNLAALCRAHHHLIHHSGWTGRIRDGTPEFTPPTWIDKLQQPRRKPSILRQ